MAVNVHSSNALQCNYKMHDKRITNGMGRRISNTRTNETICDSVANNLVPIYGSGNGSVAVMDNTKVKGKYVVDDSKDIGGGCLLDGKGDGRKIGSDTRI